MHPSIEQYLELLHTKRRAPATLKVVRQDPAHFVAWWESHRRRTFDPALLRHEDLHDWRAVRQRDDGLPLRLLTRGWPPFEGSAAGRLPVISWLRTQ
jgi:hypothetical protein